MSLPSCQFDKQLIRLEEADLFGPECPQMTLRDYWRLPHDLRQKTRAMCEFMTTKIKEARSDVLLVQAELRHKNEIFKNAMDDVQRRIRNNDGILAAAEHVKLSAAHMVEEVKLQQRRSQERSDATTEKLQAELKAANDEIKHLRQQLNITGTKVDGVEKRRSTRIQDQTKRGWRPTYH
ncbi:Hypothetical protein D9617_5g068310 [Elsinoe fawcettii]|nr:Hypothetical protein D9617_5g068310 [Elsinoe fawcettii]